MDEHSTKRLALLGGLRRALDRGELALHYQPKADVGSGRIHGVELKIDRSFVSQMATSPGDAVIVRSTIDLGHNLGLRVVAEGVETQHAWNALADLGCDTAQGYLLGRPVPATELERQLNQPAQPAADVVAETRP